MCVWVIVLLELPAAPKTHGDCSHKYGDNPPSSVLHLLFGAGLGLGLFSQYLDVFITFFGINLCTVGV